MSECKLPENEHERKQQFIYATIESINSGLEMLNKEIEFLKLLGVDIELELPSIIQLQNTVLPKEPRNIHITYYPIES